MDLLERNNASHDITQGEYDLEQPPSHIVTLSTLSCPDSLDQLSQT